MTLEKMVARARTAAILVGLACSTPAAAQTADVNMLWNTAAPSAVAFGGTTVYKVKVGNAGPSPATDVTVTATVPSGATVTGFTGCTRAAATDSFCTLASPMAAGNTIDVTVNVKYAMPAPIPTTCPAPFGPVTLTAAAASPADPTLADNTLTAAPATRPLADLGVDLTGPAGMSIDGGTYTWSFTVTNHGPCAVPDADVSVNGAFDDGLLSSGLSFVSATGICAAITGDYVYDAAGAPTDYQYCATGTLAAAATATGTKTYVLGRLRADMVSSNQVNSLRLANTGSWYTEPVEPDTTRYADNDKASTKNVVTRPVPGCSSAGGGASLFLLLTGMAAFYLARRSSSADR